LVALIKDADKKGLFQICQEMGELAKRQVLRGGRHALRQRAGPNAASGGVVCGDWRDWGGPAEAVRPGEGERNLTS